ncbi:PREDICTED: protein dead ringer [Wasmannia auropunctata]|uniref:protein dead ringer n=1 Tax=Wasmannia auropunctata TaxID=64793 RepID=UPI0005F05CE0|nr:PREDICTED: protein dead ringer [Wasmannia auropunctata]
MDPADEHDMENTGGGTVANGANGTNGTNGANGSHQTPEGSLYQEDKSEDESEIDEEMQDEEDLLSPPLQVNPQTLDATSMSSLAHLSNLMNVHHQQCTPQQLLSKLRMEHSEVDMLQSRNNLEALQAAMSSGTFSNLFPPLYMSSPPPPPPPPLPPQSSQNNHLQVMGNIGNQIVDNQSMTCPTSSSRPASTSQSNESPPRCRNNGESSQGSSRNNGESREGEARAVNNQHPSGANWSFEEQFKQLYELDDTHDRKLFLDELFTFMQNRGTPISRLPIMAKSVLDLYELYKLVVQRGGLVEVINKKLWQEIIKGLRLPASITSAAFTLRTQYMKYLYPYEKEKEGLSTQEQLQTAIETNRRESRRNNYAYSDNQVPRNQHNTLPPNSIMPLSIAQMAVAANESQHHVVNGHPHASQHHPQHLAPNIGPNQLSDYMLKLLRDRNVMSNPMIQGTSTPPPADGFKSGFHLWNTMYNQGNSNIYPGMPQPAFSPTSSHSPLAPTSSPEPQREALDLANSGHRTDPVSSPTPSRSISSPPSGGDSKRNQEAADLSSPTSAKKMCLSDDETHNIVHSLRIKQMASSRENKRRELEISIDIDGILYEGILAVKHTKQETSSNGSTSSSPDNNGKRTQNNES